MLERDVEVGQELALRHQRDRRVHVRVGVDVMQPHPDAELAERLREIEKPRRSGAAAPFARGIFEIDPVGRGVL